MEIQETQVIVMKNTNFAQGYKLMTRDVKACLL